MRRVRRTAETGNACGRIGCSGGTDGGASFSVGFLDQSGEAPPVVRMREIIRGVVESAGGELICDTPMKIPRRHR